MNARVQVNDQWSIRLMEINLHVARTAHRSWIPADAREALFDAQGALHPRAERSVSQWLLDTHGLQRQMDWEMHESEKRIWLLDAPSLTRLTRELSIVMQRNFLLREIDGSRLREIRARVDPVLWRLMSEEMPIDAAHHAEARVTFLNRMPWDLESDLVYDGARLLWSLLAPEWLALRGRARLRFDAAFTLNEQPSLANAVAITECGGLTHALGEPAAGAAIIDLIQGWLIPRRLPQWAWLF